jgi:cytochrome d ubiquinol oxidase subunit II
LTIRQAAASHDTLVAVVVAVLAGGAILFPSLVILFRLFLGGQLRYGEPTERRAELGARGVVSASAPGLLSRSAAACLIAGIGFLTVADATWAHGIGVACLFAFIVLGFAAIRPAEIAASGRAPSPSD